MNFGRSREHPEDFLLRQTPVVRNSEEWTRLEYQLRAELDAPTVTINKIWNVANPHLSSQFERRTKDMLVLDSWVASDSLEEATQDIIARGFRNTEKGLVFPHGSIRLNDTVEKDGVQYAKTKFEFLVLKVAVGRSYCLDEPLAADVKPQIPEGYQSLYLFRGEGTDSATERLKDLQDRKMVSVDGWIEGDPIEGDTYHHEYIITDAGLALPRFIVQFEFDRRSMDQKTVPNCDVCATRSATLYCAADSAKLCDNCDKEVHSVNKLVSRHVRVPLKEHPMYFGKCRDHDDTTVEYFCTTCKKPVCVKCKMIGSHSSGEKATHKLIPLAEAYKQCVAASEKDDPLLEGRRHAIKGQLQSVDERMRDVYKNSALVEEQLYQLLQDALFKLQDETQKKLSILLGDRFELRRQLEQISWVENYLKRQQEVMSPVDFLSTWGLHQHMRREIFDGYQLRKEIDVAADLKVSGGVEVVSEGEGTTDVPGLPGLANLGLGGGGGYGAQDAFGAGAGVGGVGGFGGADGFAPSTQFRASLFGRPTPQQQAQQDMMGGSNEFGQQGGMAGALAADMSGMVANPQAAAQPQPGLATPTRRRAQFATPFSINSKPISYQKHATQDEGEEGSPYIKPTNELWMEALKKSRSRQQEEKVGRSGMSSSGEEAEDRMPLQNEMDQQVEQQDSSALGSPRSQHDLVDGGEQLSDGMVQSPARGPGSKPLPFPQQAPTQPLGPDPFAIQQQQLASSPAAQPGEPVPAPAPAPADQLPSFITTQHARSRQRTDLMEQQQRRLEEDQKAKSPAAPAPQPKAQSGGVTDAPQRALSLKQEGEANQKRFATMGVAPSSTPFDESRVLDAEQAQTLYYSLPFEYCPDTNLVYATWKHGRSMSTLHALADSNGTTVVVARSGNNVFGGFASTPWNTSGVRFGTQRCFLFSLSRDARLPYYPRAGDDSLCLLGTPSSICFGGTDLVFANDFAHCTSELEHSYTAGLYPGSQDAKAFLAGQRDFQPDEVEIWNFKQ